MKMVRFGHQFFRNCSYDGSGKAFGYCHLWQTDIVWRQMTTGDGVSAGLNIHFGHLADWLTGCGLWAWQLQTASKEQLWDYNHEHYSIYWLMSILKPNMIKCTASKQKLKCLRSHWSFLSYFLSIFLLPLKSTFFGVVST